MNRSQFFPWQLSNHEVLRLKTVDTSKQNRVSQLARENNCEQWTDLFLPFLWHIHYGTANSLFTNSLWPESTHKMKLPYVK